MDERQQTRFSPLTVIDTSASSTERVRRWRQRNPELNAQRQRVYDHKYRGTAKGMLREVNRSAKRRELV